jgi:hypothetical protein
MGASFDALPAGAVAVSNNGQTCYLGDSTWPQPAFGANGMQYAVVPAP